MLWCLFPTQKLKTSGPEMIQLFLCYLAFGCVVSYHLLQLFLWLQIVHCLSKFDTLTQGYFWLPFSRAATKISICLVRWMYSLIEQPGSSWLLFSCCLWVCFLFLLSSSLLSNFTWYQTACLLFPMNQYNFAFSFVSSWLYYCSFFPSR